MGAILVAVNKASPGQIGDHLRRCDSIFIPPLSRRVDIDAYAKKIWDHGYRFEGWTGGELVGLVAVYCDDVERHTAFVTNVSVDPAHQRTGIASTLIARCLDDVTRRGFKRIDLEVARSNQAAIDLYQRLGFVPSSARGDDLVMQFDSAKERI